MMSRNRCFTGVMIEKTLWNPMYLTIRIFLPIFMLLFGSFFAEAQPGSEVHLQIRARMSSNLMGIGVEGFTSPEPAALINSVRETLIEDLNGSGLFKVTTLPESLSVSGRDLFQRW